MLSLVRTISIYTNLVHPLCSELVLLQQVEEVLNFQNAIFRQVSAVNRISYAIKSELGPKSTQK